MKTQTNLFLSIKNLIEQARTQIVRNVNTAIVYTYYHVGRIIIEDEQKGKERAEYSKGILKNLSKQLIKEFGRGYSVDNLQYMRLFYLEYVKSETASRILGKHGDQPIYETVSHSCICQAKLNLKNNWNDQFSHLLIHSIFTEH